jgi:cobalt-zinc-cadmium resistance protein CzcA
MPVLEIDVDKREIARRGLSLSAVQDVIGIAIGGRGAGVVFEPASLRKFSGPIKLQLAVQL